jgi:hypothetical protein
LRGLAGGAALRRGFDAVIDGVADHVDQGIGESLDDRPVDLPPLSLRESQTMAVESIVAS